MPFAASSELPPTTATMLRVPCPYCEASNQILMRWDQGIAACLMCGADWRKEDGSIYKLAEMINPPKESA